MNYLCAAANSAWFLSSLTVAKQFASALARPEQVQLAKLKSVVRSADNSFAREHHFEKIDSYAEFAASVPIRRYDEFFPWIERITRGEQNVLTADRITHLVPTSGATSARKLIPFTAGLQREFDAAIGPWICDLFRQHPTLVGGPAYWLITPPAPETMIDSAVPVGFESDASYLGGLKARLVKAVMIKPSSVRELDEFRFQTLSALINAPQLRLISVWHPSFLTLLLDELPKHWDRLRFECSRLKTPSPPPLAALWPHLKVISSWGDEYAAGGFDELKRRFPNAHVQAKGLLATECFVTIPFRGQYPLAINSHFFEFLDEDGKRWLAHEVKPGGTYEIVVTTSGGLYRYRLGDRVQVSNFYEGTPCLRFVGRAGGVCDLRGEKLTDAFVANCIRRLNAKVNFAMLAPSTRPEPPHYTFFVEGDAWPSIGRELESFLQENPHYAQAVSLGQLAPVEVVRLSGEAYRVYCEYLVREGARWGEIKPVALSVCAHWTERFLPFQRT